MIELKEFTKKFDGFTALEAVSFQVEEGSIFGLVGSNGAGKSTLLRGLCGVYAPDGGKVLIDGQEPYENPDVKSRVFFVSDYPYFMPQFTLSDMADALQVSPFYLSKLLNNSLHKTFTELVSERRVEASKELLKSGKRIKEIAYEVGFQGQNYFTKIFKKYTGVTPKMYKNSFDDK